MKLTNITRKFKPWRSLGVATATAGMLFAGAAAPASADDTEWVDGTLMYEEDAWYDVSEWFDGNDYNPTDEAIGRWDNETYDTDEALTSSDGDNDVVWDDDTYDSYGYADDNDSDRWFYDYYDSGYASYYDNDGDDTYEYAANYQDDDNDGYYDRMYEVNDQDNDGRYDSTAVVFFTADSQDGNQSQQTQGNQQGQQNQPEKPSDSRVHKLQGEISEVKTVQTPQGENYVVMLDTRDKGQMIVDLGPSNQYKSSPEQGQRIQVKGAKFKTGEKTVLLATTVMRDNDQVQVERSGREFTGKVQDTMTAKLRGEQHQLAKIKTDEGKHLLVDLGPKRNLDANVRDGSQITVRGPAVKVRDRVMLVAQHIEHDGKTTKVKRTALQRSRS